MKDQEEVLIESIVKEMKEKGCSNLLELNSIKDIELELELGMNLQSSISNNTLYIACSPSELENKSELMSDALEVLTRRFILLTPFYVYTFVAICLGVWGYLTFTGRHPTIFTHSFFWLPLMILVSAQAYEFYRRLIFVPSSTRTVSLYARLLAKSPTLMPIALLMGIMNMELAQWFLDLIK